MILALGAIARFWNLDWDRGAFMFHPDEAALNQAVRHLGPDLNPHFFFYGSLPIYLYRASAEALRLLTGRDWLATARIALIGRTYSALASTALLVLVYLAGRRLWGPGAGWLAAACAAAAPLLIQAAHFGTIDTAIALAAIALLWCALQIAAGGGARWYLLAGIVLGLALATKLSAASFLILPILAHVLRPRPAPAEGARPPARCHWPLALLLGSAAVTLLLAAPYYLLAWPELWQAIVIQTDELSGGYHLPYTWQFIGSIPYLFEARNLLLWGLGPVLGFAALGGGLWALQAAIRQRSAPLGLLLAWPTLYLLYIGTWETHFVRYLLPLVPFYCLYAAGGLATLATYLAQRGPGPAWAGRALCAVLVCGAGAWGLGMVSIYTRPDTRWAASDWIYAHVARRSHWLMEETYLHLPLADAAHPKGWYSRRQQIAVTAPDTPAKAADLAQQLAWGEWLAIPDQRWSAVLPRLPNYPLTRRYYALLFGGQLGYTEVATFRSPFQWGPVSWPDDQAEETFQVFDHPTVRILQNRGKLSAQAIERRLADLP